MHLTAIAVGCFPEVVSISPVVLLVCEARLTAMAALDKVLWISGKFDAGQVRHRARSPKTLL